MQYSWFFLDESGPTWFPDSDWTKFTGSAPPSVQYVSWFISVADPGCLSRILIFTHPGSQISDPGSKHSKKREGWKKILSYFFVVTNFTKLNIILCLKCWRKKFGQIFKELRIIEVFTQKVFTMLSNIWFGIRDPEKTYSGSRIQGSKRHRVPAPDPQHCDLCLLL